MRKFLPYILILVILFGFFSPVFVNAQQTQLETCLQSGRDPDGCFNQFRIEEERNAPATSAATNGKSVTGAVSSVISGISSVVIGYILGNLSIVIMGVMSYILGLAGELLNFVLKETVVKMATNISGMTGINVAWKVARDLMNIAFIFLLVYYAIEVIIQRNNKESIGKFISGIVLAAILINFSLFFTKVLIDASNIVTIGFYNSIIGPTTTADDTDNKKGLANSFQQSVGLQGFYGPEAIAHFKSIPNGDNYALVITGVMSSILFLIMTFVFFAISVMFIIRYVAFIILLALSPIGYIGMALPSFNTYSKQWWEALKSQLIFAPVYMVMTWIVITLASGFHLDPYKWTSLVGSSPSSSIDLLFGFLIVIALAIASLTISKGISTKGAAHISTATKWLTATAGGAIMGGAGRFGRSTIGRAGNAMANDEELKRKAAQGNIRARIQLAAANKAAGSSFDARATKTVGSLTKSLGIDLGKADAKKENFRAIQSEQIKKAEEQIKQYKPSDAEYAAAKKLDDDAKKPYQDIIDNDIDPATGQSLTKEQKKYYNRQIKRVAWHEKDLNKKYADRADAVARRTENKSAVWRWTANILGTAGNVVGIPGLSIPKTKTDRQTMGRKQRAVAKEKTKTEKLAATVEDAAKEKAEQETEDNEETTTKTSPASGEPTPAAEGGTPPTT